MSMIKRFTATVKECWSEAKQDEHIRVDHKHPRIGVCVIIFNEKRQILLGLRGQSHGARSKKKQILISRTSPFMTLSKLCSRKMVSTTIPSF
jgi:hypothetical protein